eukprot:861892-Heterocapsa_arctica.AAC.1
MGATKPDSVHHNREVKEALITLVTTYRCLGSRASHISMPPQWEVDGIFNIFYDGDQPFLYDTR